MYLSVTEGTFILHSVIFFLKISFVALFYLNKIEKNGCRSVAVHREHSSISDLSAEE
jgi:hypothetical protein